MTITHHGSLLLVSVIGHVISVSIFITEGEGFGLVFALYGIIISGCLTLIFLFLCIYHARKIKDLPEVDKDEILRKMALEDERKRFN